ncbi:hypothetical protein GCM10027277_08300 [Pseudoduganella ginsengisoli]|uniref:DUF6896 domain-containing protein n=1 Tax=Pseudoduganella ginsengisoli TaxID=1462440 RepID=A0A6L6Q0R9_9BURK|nr:hypothetical protein [Pseudoduganella ginsengisoli]MTW03230.1 hypothetical protein [Pseudoduganella ginsengisoli]
MNPRLARLIADYQTTVFEAVALLKKSGIPLPSSNTEWTGIDIPARGTLESGVPYFKHGYGCAVRLPAGSVDFDFGANGEIDGFDSWRLVSFAGDKLSEYGFANDAAMQACFKNEIAAGTLIFSGYILYYIAESIAQPNIPADACRRR